MPLPPCLAQQVLRLENRWFCVIGSDQVRQGSS
jgi:hypothetical protein